MAFQPTKRQLASSLLRARPTAVLATVTRSLLTTRLNSSSSAPPPLLQKLKGDLKTAMRAKDTARLGVLRSILAEITNASKTNNQITTDVQLVALLQKNMRACEDAKADFEGAGRDDLVEKEKEQIDIMDEYVSGSGVQSVGGEELKALVAGVVTAMTSKGQVQGKANMGDVMKKLLAPGGPLEGKSVEKAELARVVKEAVE